MRQTTKVVQGLVELQKTELSHRHHYPPSQSTSVRDPTFKVQLLTEYGCTDVELPGVVRCMLLDKFFKARLVCGAHLFKYAWRADVFRTLGFRSINDVHNGVVLLKPLEEAFDCGYIIFESIVETGEYKAHWLGDDKSLISSPSSYPFKRSNSATKNDSGMASEDLAERRTELPGVTFKEAVEGKTLVFTTQQRPFRRCFYYQACKAIEMARSEGRIKDDSWFIGKSFKLHSPTSSHIEYYLGSFPTVESARVSPPASDTPSDSDNDACGADSD